MKKRGSFNALCFQGIRTEEVKESTRTFIFYNAADMNNWNGTLFSFLSGLNASRPPLLIIGIMN